MSATTVITCDHGPCEATFSDSTDQRWLARIRAEHEGWECDVWGDMCPVHHVEPAATETAALEPVA